MPTTRPQADAGCELLENLLYLRDHGLERSDRMLDDGWFDDDFAVEVGEHPFGASLGAIHRDHRELLWSGLLDSLLDKPTGLADVASFCRF